jgi:hypothetical protein
MTSTVTPAFAPGARLGKYLLVRLIGEGGMGAVYEAIHSELRKRVAIKTLLPDIAAIPEARARFLREGQATSRIRHAHVVDVTDVDSHEGVPFLVMEFLDGENLAEHFAQAGALPLERLVDLMLPVLSGVAAGHDAGVIHRDLKPHNIFMARGRRGEVIPKVLDFGISKVMVAEITGRISTATGASFGTVAYMSPEQAAGAKHVDARSDQYALALIVYEGVTGERAHQEENVFALLRQIAEGRVRRPRSLRPDLPEEFEQALLRALSARPDQRYPTIDRFAEALLPFASERARLLWSESFRGNAEAAPSGERPVAVGPLPTQVLAAAPRPLTGGAQPQTTLRGAASELDALPAGTRPRRTALFVVVGVSALAAIGVAFAMGWLPGATSGQPASATRPPAEEARSPAIPLPSPSPSPPAPAPLPAEQPPPAPAATAEAPAAPPPQPEQPATAAAPVAPATAATKKARRPPVRSKRTAAEENAPPAAANPPPATPKTGTNNAIILP